MAKETIRTVDFIPQKDILGDFKKISEYDISVQNTKVFSIVSIICMEEGANALYPEMGLRQAFVSLPYREMNEVYPLLERINSHIIMYTGYSVKVYIDETDSRTNFITGSLILRIDVEGLLAPLKVNVDRNNGFRVFPPSLFK